MQQHTLPPNHQIQDTPNQLEDKVLKTAAMFFGQDLLPYLGVRGRITSLVPTEQIHLELRRMEEDSNYMMEDGLKVTALLPGICGVSGNTKLT